jgi:hypothetical protein
MENREKITGLSIPDEDMPGWIRVLRESDLTNEEVEQILLINNKTYARETLDIEEIINAAEAELLRVTGEPLTEHEKNRIRKKIEGYFEVK